MGPDERLLNDWRKWAMREALRQNSWFPDEDAGDAVAYLWKWAAAHPDQAISKNLAITILKRRISDSIRSRIRRQERESEDITSYRGGGEMGDDMLPPTILDALESGDRRLVVELCELYDISPEAMARLLAKLD